MNSLTSIDTALSQITSYGGGPNGLTVVGGCASTGGQIAANDAADSDVAQAESAEAGLLSSLQGYVDAGIVLNVAVDVSGSQAVLDVEVTDGSIGPYETWTQYLRQINAVPDTYDGIPTEITTIDAVPGYF